MKKILEKSGESQGILSEEKSGNPAPTFESNRGVMTVMNIIFTSKTLVNSFMNYLIC